MDLLFKWTKEKSLWVIFCAIAIVTVLGTAIPRTEFNSGFRVYFSEDNPQMKAFEALEHRFNKQDSVIFIVAAKSGDIFTKETLELIQQITEKAWQTPYSRRVNSITNFLITYSKNDELLAEELVPPGTVLSSEKVTAIKKTALNDVLAKQLLSADGSVTLIEVALTLPNNNHIASNEVVSYSRSLLAQLEPSLQHNVDLLLSGSTTINHSVVDALKMDLTKLVPASFTLIFMAMLLLTRSLSGTLLTITIIGLCNITVFGSIAWLGITLSPAVSSAPSMIMIIAVADCMHLLISYYHELSEGKEKPAAIENALRINLRPIFITSLTTAIGLMCLNFSESPPYRHLGNIVAFATMTAFVFSITVLPAMLYLIPAKSKRDGRTPSHHWHFALMEGLSNWVIKHYRSLMIVVLLPSLLLFLPLFENKLEDSWDEYYDDTFEIKKVLDVLENRAFGVHYIDYQIISKTDNGILEPGYMKDLDKLTTWLRQQPKVGEVSSFSDRVKNLNRSLHNNDEAYFNIPDDKELLAQSILIYEMSLSYGMGIEEQVDFDKSSTRTRVFLYKMSDRELIAFNRQVLDWIAINCPNIEIPNGSGLDMVFAHITYNNVVSLVKGTALALALISVLLMLVLKSVKLGLISLVPNLFPAAVAYGIWGLFVGKIDLAVSIVGTMSLGLVVDDTVHFLSKYQVARTDKNKGVYQAIRYAFSTVGVAMVITSIVLTLGFLLLAFSHFTPTWSMGLMLSITIVAALFIDFLLLPGLLILFDKEKPETVAKTH